MCLAAMPNVCRKECYSRCGATLVAVNIKEPVVVPSTTPPCHPHCPCMLCPSDSVCHLWYHRLYNCRIVVMSLQEYKTGGALAAVFSDDTRTQYRDCRYVQEPSDTAPRYRPPAYHVACESSCCLYPRAVIVVVPRVFL